MRSGLVRHARWVRHANGVNPSVRMRQWLADTSSLTLKLIAASSSFRVQRLRQGKGYSLADEYAVLSLPRRACVREREVMLECDGRPIVFAHTIVPLAATAVDWPFFNSLGDRSLGTTLFGDPQVTRGPMQFARLGAGHPLAQRARAAAGADWDETSPLLARRCRYARNRGVLLVTEVFLPAIVDLVCRAQVLKRRSPVQFKK